MFVVRLIICNLSAAIFRFESQKRDAIQGIKVPGGVVKISAYADDLVMFCNDQSDISKTFSFLIRCLK